MNEDAIDRKLVCAFIDGLISDDGERKKGLEYIRHMPPVNPQKPKSEWEYDHAILRAYSDGANDVLDKIRAEIKQLPYQRIFGNVSSYSLLDTVVEIIDHYKAESEDKT